MAWGSLFYADYVKYRCRLHGNRGAGKLFPAAGRYRIRRICYRGGHDADFVHIRGRGLRAMCMYKEPLPRLTTYVTLRTTLRIT